MTRRDLTAFLSSLTPGPAQTHRNLRMVPVLGSDVEPSGLLTLDEALGRGLAEVTEVSEEGDVPRLLFLNHGDAPILMIDGEELIGARQNRILNISILAPGRESLEVPVSCIEQGRWAWSSRRFTSSDRVIYASLRRANVESVSANLRRRGWRHADQYAVWSSIAAKSVRLDAASQTWAAGALYDRHAAALEEFVQGFRPAARQVGAIFYVNGRLAGLETFAAPDLFARLMAKIVRGYALDALDDALHEPALRDALDGATLLSALGRCRLTRHRAVGQGEDIRLAAPGFAGAALVAGGKPVHLTAYATT
jgi:hypothetical protein